MIKINYGQSPWTALPSEKTYTQPPLGGVKSFVELP